MEKERLNIFNKFLENRDEVMKTQTDQLNFLEQVLKDVDKYQFSELQSVTKSIIKQNMISIMAYIKLHKDIFTAVESLIKKDGADDRGSANKEVCK